MKHISSKTLPESRFRLSVSVVFLVVFSIFAIALPGYGQQGGVTTELTSSGLGTEIVAPPSGGHVYNINGGTVKTGSLGNNLFHSFGEFSVGLGDIARFNNTTSALSIANILARVTGENPSSIYGTVESTINGANLFLINPRGVVFGPNASFQVSGSVHFSTANAIVHSNGARFDMASTSDTLTAAPISTFGFLGNNIGSLLVQGSQLAVPTGKTLSLIGGNVEIQAGTLDDGSVQTAHLTAPSGQINLASVNSAANISLTTLETTPTGGNGAAGLGIILITQQSLLDASGSPGGTIHIRGGQFTLDRSAVTVSHAGEGTAGEINIAADSVSLIGGAQIVSANAGTTPGPAITVTASDSVSIAGFDAAGTLTGIVPSVFGPVPSGIISTTSSSGAGGAVTITQQGSSLFPTVTVEEGGAIASITSGTGPGGDLVLTDIKALDVKSGGQITSTSGVPDLETGEILGSGAGGHVTIKADESVSVAGGQLDLFQQSAIFSNTNTIGNGGDISISAPTIAINDGGVIVASTGATGAGGAITLTDFSTLSLAGFSPDFLHSAIVSSSSSEGVGGQIMLSSSAGTVLVDQLGVIRSQNTGLTSGGDIMVSARDIMVTNGGAIEAGATSATGSSGKITLTADNDVHITGQAPDPFNPDAFARSHVSNNVSGVDNQSGRNNGIAIAATHDIAVASGGRIESITDVGGGGTVSISADNAIVLSDPLTVGRSTHGGPVGSLTLEAPAITLENHAAITSSSASNANAGEIRLTGDTITLVEGSYIRSNTDQGTGRGGAIFVDAEDSVFLSGGSSIQSNTTTSQGGHAGSVTVQANNLISLSGTETGVFSESGSSTSPGTGNGGTISVRSTQVRITDGAVISAKSNGSGNAGNISINAGQLFEMRNSSVTTQASQASGGNIDIQAIDQVRLVNSTISTSVLGGAGSGGNITIDPNVVVLQNSNVIAIAVHGAGGNITIFTPLFLADSSSLVSASSQFGLNGTVTIQSPTSNLSGSLGTLTSKPSQAQSLLTQRCAALANGQASSFVVAGREQLPADPGSWLSSPIALAALGESLDANDAAASAPAIMAMAAQDSGTVSLRRLTPAGFLIANFADSEATGCHS